MPWEGPNKMTVYDFSLHDVGESAFKALHKKNMAARQYDPTAGSLTRQMWAYQQKMIDMSGDTFEDDGLGDITRANGKKSLGDYEMGGYAVLPCLAAIAATGYVACKVGVIPTALGLAAAIFVMKNLGE